MPDRSPLHELTASAGAVFAEDAGWLMPLHYGDPLSEHAHACHHAALFDVSHRDKIEVAGTDAVDFLHNLCTNDIKKLPAGSACEAFLCTQAARVVAHMHIYHLPPALWLDLAPGQSDKVMKHLRRYIISEDVTLADRTREYAQLHLAGPEAATVHLACPVTTFSAHPARPHNCGKR
jgi:glycine cleavage system aminomethyltransferase T